MDVPTALTSLSQAIGIAKLLGDINRDFDQSVFKIQIADLRSNLADAKVALTELGDDLRERDAEVGRLKQAFAVKGTLKRQGGFDFLTEPDGSLSPGYAVCPRCLTVDARVLQLVRHAHDGRRTAMCPQCKTLFDSGDTWSGG